MNSATSDVKVAGAEGTHFTDIQDAVAERGRSRVRIRRRSTNRENTIAGSRYAEAGRVGSVGRIGDGAIQYGVRKTTEIQGLIMDFVIEKGAVDGKDSTVFQIITDGDSVVARHHLERTIERNVPSPGEDGRSVVVEGDRLVKRQGISVGGENPAIRHGNPAKLKLGTASNRPVRANYKLSAVGDRNDIVSIPNTWAMNPHPGLKPNRAGYRDCCSI